MKKQRVKFFHALARQLQSWADFVSKQAGDEEQPVPAKAERTATENGAVTSGMAPVPTHIGDNPPAHWLARVTPQGAGELTPLRAPTNQQVPSKRNIPTQSHTLPAAQGSTAFGGKERDERLRPDHGQPQGQVAETDHGRPQGQVAHPDTFLEMPVSRVQSIAVSEDGVLGNGDTFHQDDDDAMPHPRPASPPDGTHRRGRDKSGPYEAPLPYGFPHIVSGRELGNGDTFHQDDDDAMPHPRPASPPDGTHRRGRDESGPYEAPLPYVFSHIVSGREGQSPDYGRPQGSPPNPALPPPLRDTNIPPLWIHSLARIENPVESNTQTVMSWPSLPDEVMTNSQDWEMAQRIWQRQQRLDEEQRGNSWNA